MNRNKFAAVTASLLARKGEAAPWRDAAPVLWPPAALVDGPRFVAPETPRVAHETSAAPLKSDALKRCTVRLTQREYEKLGILAVKKNLTRQQLLQAALAEVLAGMAQACAPDCGCLNNCNGR